LGCFIGVTNILQDEKFIESLICMGCFAGCAIGFLPARRKRDLSNTKALSKSSELTTGLYRLAMNNTSVDNFIDHSSAFRIEFPYQAIVNGQSIGLASEADYQTIRDIFAASASDVDSITLAFPLTVSLVNYTQQLLGSQQALDDFRDNTAAPGNPAIPCIAVQYPL
jgi:hypothetical protein